MPSKLEKGADLIWKWTFFKLFLKLHNKTSLIAFSCEDRVNENSVLVTIFHKMVDGKFH